MRIAHPCSESLPSMPRTPGGVHCGKCDRDVLDLRRVPRKRALAVLAEARESGDGRVCAWVRAAPDGTPVFAPDPSRLARFAAPVLAGALAACTTAASPAHESTPIAFVQPIAPVAPAPSSGGNTNAVPAPVTVVATTPPSPIQPASNVPPVTIEMAGDMAF